MTIFKWSFVKLVVFTLARFFFRKKFGIKFMFNPKHAFFYMINGYFFRIFIRSKTIANNHSGLFQKGAERFVVRIFAIKSVKSRAL